MIYLDNAATSFPKPPAVLDAITRWFTEIGVDATRGSSLRHDEVEVAVSDCRRHLAALCGVPPDHVVFCSGATEAINLYLKGTLGPGDRVWTTRLEHNAVVRPLVGLRERGVDVRFFEPATHGVEPGQVRDALAAEPPPDVFVFSHASNVTGAIQDFGPVAAELHDAGTRILTDCAQSAGRLDLAALEADAWALPGHKGLMGPPGIGALCLGGDPEIRALREGGTGSSRAADRMPDELPAALEGGTPNTPGILGWLAGIRWVEARGIEAIRRHEDALVRVLRDELAEAAAAGRLRRIGAESPATHTAVLSVVFADVDPVEAAMILAQHDVCARAGFHCAPYVHEGIGTAAAGTLRLSPGPFNTEDEVRGVARLLAGVARG